MEIITTVLAGLLLRYVAVSNATSTSLTLRSSIETGTRTPRLNLEVLSADRSFSLSAERCVVDLIKIKQRILAVQFLETSGEHLES